MKKLIFLSVFLISLVSFGQKKLYVDELGHFQNGYAVVRKGNVVAFIDTIGNELKIDNVQLKRIDNSYIGMQKNGFFINTEEKGISIKGEQGIRNLKGDYVIPPKYNITMLNDFYIVEDRSNILEPSFSVLDENCNSIFETSDPLRVKRPIIPLTNNIIAVANKGYPARYKLIFIAENRETDYIYGDFGKIKNGLIKASKYVKSEGKFKWGFLDEKGQKVIDFIYTNPPGDFDSNLAVVKNLEGKFGYINNKNEIVIETNLIAAYGFIQGKALVRVHKYQKKDGEVNNGYRIINNKGEIIYDLKDLKPNHISHEYYKKTIIEKNNIIRLKNSKSEKFILDLDNLELIKVEFIQINKFDSGLSLVKFYDTKRKRQDGYANKKGELIMIKSKREF